MSFLRPVVKRLGSSGSNKSDKSLESRSKGNEPPRSLHGSPMASKTGTPTVSKTETPIASKTATPILAPSALTPPDSVGLAQPALVPDMTAKQLDAGTAFITIDASLPSTLARPVCAIVSEITSSTCQIGLVQLRETEQALEAQTYFAACKQLYSLMTRQERLRLGPLAQLPHEACLLPQCLAVALFSLLSLETQLGDVRIKHSELLFRRWLAKGLELFPGSRYSSKPADGFIWQNESSKLWLNDQLLMFGGGKTEAARMCQAITRSPTVAASSPVYDIIGVRVAPPEYEDSPMTRQWLKNVQLYNDRYNVIVGTVLKNAQF